MTSLRRVVRDSAVAHVGNLKGQMRQQFVSRIDHPDKSKILANHALNLAL